MHIILGHKTAEKGIVIPVIKLTVNGRVKGVVFNNMLCIL